MAYNELFSNNGIDTDDANATASQILSGYTAYVKGKKITGNIQSQDGQTITPMSSIQVIRTKDKYLTGDITVKGDSSLLAGNIRKGATIFGISGTYTSDANAGAGDILSGKSAYVNGSKITGNIANYGKLTNAVSSIFVEGGEAGTGLYVRIQRGAYLTNQSSGYPEVFLPYNKIDPYRGQWQDAGSIGGGGEYVALNKIPNGFYYSEGATSWAPEVRVNTDQLRNYLGTVHASCVIMSHQNYDYDDAAQWAINQSANIVTHVSTNKGVATFKFNIAARMYIISTFFHYAETGSVGTCSLNGWVNTSVGQTFTITTYIGGTNAHGNNKRVIAAVSISY